MKFILLTGSAGSGKTYYAKKLQGLDKNLVRVSSDEVRYTVTKTNTYNNILQKRYIKTFRKCHKIILTELKKGNDVIYDACNLARFQRQSIIKKIRHIENIEIVCIHFRTPFKQCLVYNSLRKTHTNKVLHIALMRMLSRIHRPTLKEGYNAIYKPETYYLKLRDEVVE